MSMAAVTGASLRLIGDPAQHGAIAAGGMFRVLCERHERDTPELTTTHRLQDPRGRAAAQALREGRIDEAFDQLAAAGHLHVGRRRPRHVPPSPRPLVERPPGRRRPPDGRPAQQHPPPAQPPRPPPAARQRRTRRRRDHRTDVAVHHDRRDTADDALTVDFDGIGRIDIPRSFFDHYRTPAGRPEVGIDRAYALTSYAVQGSTRDISTSRVDATATRAETYVDITRGRHANHLYLTAASDPLDGEALPRVPPAPADLAVAERLHRSTGELTAWELAHPAEGPRPGPEQAVGI